MPAPFAIYVRVSDTGGRENLHSPQDQEAAARAWAEPAGVDVCFDEDACVDLDVSGGVGRGRPQGSAADRAQARARGRLLRAGPVRLDTDEGVTSPAGRRSRARACVAS